MVYTTNLVLRASFILLGSIGFAVYFLLIFLAWHDWSAPEVQVSINSKLKFVLVNVIFGSGLMPLMLAVYFFFYESEFRGYFFGVVSVAGFIYFHFIVMGVEEFRPSYISWPLIAVEIFGAAALIYWWENRSTI